MVPGDISLTTTGAAELLRQDGMNVFLGSAFVTAGMVAGLISLARRRYDALLLSLATFSLAYGVRLWLQTRLLTLALPGHGFGLVRMVIDYLVPLPAIWFFFQAGFLKRGARLFAVSFGVLLCLLLVATLVWGPLPIFHRVNDLAVIASCVLLFTVFAREGPENHELIVVKRGLLVFLGLILAENVAHVFHRYNRVELYGFAIFLASLGYVAVHRALQQGRQLNELQSELEIAQRIQQSILPAGFPESASFRVCARYRPMTSVAGDFYDYLVADNTRAGLLIADVSGHGVPAALIASMVKLAAASQRENAATPDELMRGMNRTLCGNTQSQFVTAAYVYLNSATAELHYSAAAHPPMLLLRRGEVSGIAENGLMLAAFDFASYTTAVKPLEPGDRIVLYTDGLVEAANIEGEEFGPERLNAVVKATGDRTGEEAADLILSAVQQWSVRQDDDRTLLVCDYVGRGRV